MEIDFADQKQEVAWTSGGKNGLIFTSGRKPDVTPASVRRKEMSRMSSRKPEMNYNSGRKQEVTYSPGGRQRQEVTYSPGDKVKTRLVSGGQVALEEAERGSRASRERAGLERCVTGCFTCVSSFISVSSTAFLLERNNNKTDRCAETHNKAVRKRETETETETERET